VPEPKILGGGEQGFTFLVKEPSRFGIISGGVTAISAKETKTPVVKILGDKLQFLFL
jgi:hypothetical protein